MDDDYAEGIKAMNPTDPAQTQARDQVLMKLREDWRLLSELAGAPAELLKSKMRNDPRFLKLLRKAGQILLTVLEESRIDATLGHGGNVERVFSPGWTYVLKMAACWIDLGPDELLTESARVLAGCMERIKLRGTSEMVSENLKRELDKEIAQIEALEVPGRELMIPELKKWRIVTEEGELLTSIADTVEANPDTPLSEVMRMITEVKERKDDKDAE